MHRRRIEIEEKAKIVTAVWGKEFIQFLAAPFPGEFSINHPGAKIVLCFFSIFILLLWGGHLMLFQYRKKVQKSKPWL